MKRVLYHCYCYFQLDGGVASVSREKFLTSSLKAGRGEANKFLRNELRCKSEKSIVTPFEERNVI